jgi:hypothetical protein
MMQNSLRLICINAALHQFETGELSGVIVHEWGHGLDNNDNDGKISKPSGEGIADVYAALRMDDSCIGRGFFRSGGSCTGAYCLFNYIIMMNCNINHRF